MVRSTDITSITEHRDHLREHLDRVNSTGRPMYITTNGKTEGILLSPAAYDALAEQAELAATLAMLERSKADIAAGRVRDAQEGMRQLAARHGVKIKGKPA